MMATVRHVTAWAGRTKYQADGFLLGEVYQQNRSSVSCSSGNRSNTSTGHVHAGTNSCSAYCIARKSYGWPVSTAIPLPKCCIRGLYFEALWHAQLRNLSNQQTNKI